VEEGTLPHGTNSTWNIRVRNSLLRSMPYWVRWAERIRQLRGVVRQRASVPSTDAGKWTPLRTTGSLLFGNRARTRARASIEYYGQVAPASASITGMLFSPRSGPRIPPTHDDAAPHIAEQSSLFHERCDDGLAHLLAIMRPDPQILRTREGTPPIPDNQRFQ